MLYNNRNELITLLRHLKGVKSVLEEQLRLLDQHIGGIEWTLTRTIDNIDAKST